MNQLSRPETPEIDPYGKLVQNGGRITSQWGMSAFDVWNIWLSKWGKKNVKLDLYLTTSKEVNSGKLKTYTGNAEMQGTIFQHWNRKAY